MTWVGEELLRSVAWVGRRTTRISDLGWVGRLRSCSDLDMGRATEVMQ